MSISTGQKKKEAKLKEIEHTLLKLDQERLPAVEQNINDDSVSFKP